jgi:hypothetical protein
MPAEIRQIEAQGKAGFQEVLSGVYFVRFVIDI